MEIFGVMMGSVEKYMLKGGVLFFCCLFVGSLLYAQTWNRLKGTDITAENASVRAMTIYNGELIVAGGLGEIDTFGSLTIASYDGENWLPLGEGITSAWIQALLIHEGNLYVGGGFSGAGGNPDIRKIAYWDGSTWNALPEYVNSIVDDIAVYRDKLYATGSFSASSSGQELLRILSYDGTQFHNVGSLSSQGDDLTIFDDKLIASGLFYYADGKLVKYIASYDEENWSDLGGGVGGEYVWATAVDTVNNYLYAGGMFFWVNNNETYAPLIARWDGQQWYAMGDGAGFECDPMGMSIYKNQLYVGGCFEQAGGKDIKHVTRWDGTEWQPLGSPTGTNSWVTCFQEYQDDLYVGGWFSTAGDTAVTALARWHYPLESACATMYADIAPHPDTLYVSELPYTFRSGCYGNSSLLWEFSDGHIETNGHAPHDFNLQAGTYEISLSATCSNTEEIATSQVVVIDDVNSLDKNDLRSSVRIYPNPAKNVLHIESKAKNIYVELYDNNGKKVLSEKLQDQKIALSGLEKGVYSIKINTDEGTIREKVVVE